MAIESAAFLRRFARTECLALLVLIVICVCGTAVAQSPSVPTVISGSVMPFDHDQTGQIYNIAFPSNGDVIFLDCSAGALYQLKPDGKTFVAIAAPGAGTFTGYNNAAMAIDPKTDTLYITDRWGGKVMYKVPYDKTKDTWTVAPADADPFVNFAAKPGGADLKSSAGVVRDPIDGSLIFSRETPDMSINRLTLDANGDPLQFTQLLVGLKKRAAKMDIDKYGNVYFIEEPWLDPSQRCEGVYMLPRGYTDLSGLGTDGKGTGYTADCTLEGKLPRVDPIGTGTYNGVTVDPNGNLYLTSQLNASYNDLTNMVVFVPNELQADSTYKLNPEHAAGIAPASAAANVAIDPHGFLWIPTGSGQWDNMPGTYNFVKWFLGSAEVPAAPVGTVGTDVVRVYYAFNGDVTPKGFALASGGSSFTIVPTDPVSSSECVLGTTYHQWGSCYIQVALSAAVPGDVSDQLLMLDAASNVLASTYLHGVGKAPGVSAFMPPATPVQIGSNLTLQKQLAVDAHGNLYIAAGSRVTKFSAGATTGTSIGTGLTAPSGVAVDGTGNIFIADAGKIYKVPHLPSGSYGAQSTILSGLGPNVRLAIDGAGNVYANDVGNKSIVKIVNSSTVIIMSGKTTVPVGAGPAAAGAVTSPSNIASDAEGNLVVVDGSNLVALPALGGKVAIKNNVGTVNGIAIDASGSVYVAQSDGVHRIPSVGDFSYNVTNEVVLAPAAITSAATVAVDLAGNLYVGQGTSITQLSYNSVVDFNASNTSIVPNLEAAAQIQLFNTGNTSLTFDLRNSVFGDLTCALGCDSTWTAATLFETMGADNSPNCDPNNPTEAGGSCWFGIGMTAPKADTYAASLAIASDAKNAAPTVALSGTAQNDLRPATHTAITFTMDKPDYPATVTVKVTVTPDSGTAIPTGNVYLSISGKPKQELALEADGTASYQYTDLAGGPPGALPDSGYIARASYPGDGDAFAASGATNTFKVTRAPAIGAVSANFNFQHFVLVGSSFTLTGTITADPNLPAKPTGTVKFVEMVNGEEKEYGSSTIDANGEVFFNTSKLDVDANGVSLISSGAVSQHQIVAKYMGDINFAPAVSAPMQVDLINRSVYADTTGAAFTLAPGTPQVKTVTISKLEGFGNQINLLCTNLPQYSQCTFNTPSVNFGKTDSFDIEVMISTNVPVNVNASVRPSAFGSSPWLFASMFGVGIMGLVVSGKAKRSGRTLMTICIVLIAISALAGMSGCTNSGYTKTPPAPHVVTPAGAYNVTLIGLYGGHNVIVPNTIPVTVQAAQ
jgi:Bacterial Ig-like domain (group 3)